jgi:dTDP-4-amino-4,6-dideoxygalactose transaminase
MSIMGSEHPAHVHWVFPLLVEEPDEMVAQLRRRGFDASRKTSSLAVCTSNERQEEAWRCKAAFQRLIYLPFDSRISEREILTLAKVLRDYHGHLGPPNPDAQVSARQG